MKSFTFSTLFAFLATSMMVNGMLPAPEWNDAKYQSYVSRMSTPGSVTVNTHGYPNCRPGADNCVFTYVNTESEYQKYSLYPLDGTTATTNHNYTVHKGSYDINQWSGVMWSDKPLRVLMTCGEGNGNEVDYKRGFATIAFQKGYASFNAWNGAKGRYDHKGPFIEAAQSKTSNVIEFICPTVKQTNY